MLSETQCGPLCQHPACWASINRQMKGIRRREEMCNLTDSSDEEEDELPTQKVYNMLDDFGSDSRDRYPSKFQGRPKERQRSMDHMPYMPLRTGTTAPYTTPATMSGGPRKFNTPQISAKEVRRIPQFNKVEVQELFDLEDLEKDWHETFFASKYYVWVPGRKKASENVEKEQRLTISQLSQGPVPIPPKDVTESMVPIELERQRELEQSFPTIGPLTQRRNRNRRSSTPRRPTSGQTRFINLLDLPRDILKAILESLEESKNLTREEVQNALLQIVPAFSRHETALTTFASDSILRQQKVKLVESQQRNVRQPTLYQTQPTFMLDEEMHPDERYEVESVISSNREVRSLSDYPAGYNKKKPLPSLSAQNPSPTKKKSDNKLTSISLGLPEIPTGYKYTKPFTYYRGKDLDFGLAPVSTVAPSDRQTMSRETDIDSTLHVTIPTVASERDELEYVHKMRRNGEPLHAVSPADSTNVPKAPAATPATRQGSKASGGLGTPQSETIQVPLHAPPASPVSIEAPGLPRELSSDAMPCGNKAQQIAELQASQNQLKSRSGRNVHFAPAVTTEAQQNTPVQKAPAKLEPADRQATNTSANSMAVNGAQVIRSPSTGTPGYPTLIIKDKEGSVASTPEPWPQVNEEEYMDSPTPRPEEQENTATETPENRINKELSGATLATTTIGSESSPSGHSELALRLLKDSPAPPPPSPEMRQASLTEPETPSPEKDPRKEVAMLPVVEEEQTEGTITDRTDGQYDRYDVDPEEAEGLANMASDAIAGMMLKLGSNFPSPELMMSGLVPPPDSVEAQKEMTEDGGDHDGFKENLREELENLEKRFEDHDGDDQKNEKAFGAWEWMKKDYN